MKATLLTTTLLLIALPTILSSHPHVSDPHTIDHILIMRFCLPNEGKEYNEGACSAYLTLFESTMLLSLREQNVDFRVLAYVPHQMSEPLRARLQSLLAPFKHYIAPVTFFFEPGWHNQHLAEAQEQYNLFVQNASQSPAHTRITSRIDIDDFMHRTMLENIQAMHTYPRVNGVLVINQLRGYRMVFTPDPDNPAAEPQCYLGPMDFPFQSTGQSLLTNADKTFSILDFKHTRESFVGPLLESAGIDSTDAPSIVAVFKTVPLERGYIYVRHSLSHSGNLMEVPQGAMLCAEAADELYEGFAVTQSDVRRVGSFTQATSHADEAH